MCRMALLFFFLSLPLGPLYLSWFDDVVQIVHENILSHTLHTTNIQKMFSICRVHTMRTE